MGQPFMKHNYSPLNIALTVLADVLSVFLVVLLCSLGTFIGGGLNSIQIWGIVIYGLSFALILCLVFCFFGIYRLLTDNFGMLEAIKVALIILCVNVVGYLVMFFVPDAYLPTFNLAVFFLGMVVMMFLCDGFRTLKRVIKYAATMIKKRRSPLKRTLVIGAGSAAKIVIDDSRNNIDSKSHVVLLVDDDPSKINRTLSGIPVKGPISSVSSFVAEYKIDEVIIAIQALDKTTLNRILSYLRDVDVQVKRLPILSELGSVNERTVLNVDINDILGRPQVSLDNSQIKEMLTGKCVLVTGAGGSIGSELVRQIYKTHPATWFCSIFTKMEFMPFSKSSFVRLNVRIARMLNWSRLIGSTYNEVRMEQIFMQYKPDYIYHAAAYKHVPLMEESPVEAVRTNVVGTYNVAKLADKYHVKKMLLISTDKAVRPTNAMGATKRLPK
jgi:FlaA1/EpsC-like NDP-sugar epimerase